MQPHPTYDAVSYPTLDTNAALPQMNVNEKQALLARQPMQPQQQQPTMYVPQQPQSYVPVVVQQQPQAQQSCSQESSVPMVKSVFGTVCGVCCTIVCLVLGLSLFFNLGISSFVQASFVGRDARVVLPAQNCTVLSRNDTQHMCYQKRGKHPSGYACVDVTFSISFVANESVHVGLFHAIRNATNETLRQMERFDKVIIGESVPECWYRPSKDAEDEWEVQFWPPMSALAFFLPMGFLGLCCGCCYCCYTLCCVGCTSKNFCNCVRLIKKRKQQQIHEQQAVQQLSSVNQHYQPNHMV